MLFACLWLLFQKDSESKSEMYVNPLESAEVEEAEVWLGRI